MSLEYLLEFFKDNYSVTKYNLLYESHTR